MTLFGSIFGSKRKISYLKKISDDIHEEVRLFFDLESFCKKKAELVNKFLKSWDYGHLKSLRRHMQKITSLIEGGQEVISRFKRRVERNDGELIQAITLAKSKSRKQNIEECENELQKLRHVLTLEEDTLSRQMAFFQATDKDLVEQRRNIQDLLVSIQNEARILLDEKELLDELDQNVSQLLAPESTRNQLLDDITAVLSSIVAKLIELNLPIPKSFKNAKATLDKCRKGKKKVYSLYGPLKRCYSELEKGDLIPQEFLVRLRELITRLEEPKDISRRKFVRKAVIVGVASVVAMVGLVKAGKIAFKTYYNYILNEARKLPIKENNGLAVLVTKPGNRLDERIFGQYAPGYIARMELEFGFRAKPENEILNATDEDLDRVLYDPSVQNICVLGHGTWNSWETYTWTVHEADLFLLSQERPCHKSGLLLKHTCGRLEKPEYNPVHFRWNIYRVLENERLNVNKKLPECLSKAMMDKSYSLPTRNYKVEFDRYQSDAPPNLIWAIRVTYDEIRGNTVILHSEYYEPKSSVPGLTGEMADLINGFVDKVNKLASVKENVEPFGYGFFKRENVRCWDRIAYFQDFLLNPFAT